MSTLTIGVTEQDIEQGEYNSTVLCPIALASDRALRTVYGPRGVAVNVGSKVIEVWLSGHYGTPDFDIDLPLQAQGFIEAFDAQDPESAHYPPLTPPEPFEFVVTVPDPVDSNA